MSTPTKPSVITPYKPAAIRDLPCATSGAVPQPSKPAPIYTPTAAVKPTPPVASTYANTAPSPIRPAVYNPAPKVQVGMTTASDPVTPRTPLYNPAPTVPSLTNDLSQVTLTLSDVSKELGFTGPSRDLLVYVKQLKTNYVNRMAADYDRLASDVETQEKALAKFQITLGSINAEDQSLLDGIETGVKAIAALIDGMKARNPFDASKLGQGLAVV